MISGINGLNEFLLFSVKSQPRLVWNQQVVGYDRRSRYAEDTMRIGKVLLVFANHPMEPLMPLGVAMLATVLEDYGFDVRLFDTTFYPNPESDSQADRVISGQIKGTRTIRSLG